MSSKYIMCSLQTYHKNGDGVVRLVGGSEDAMVHNLRLNLKV